MKISNTTAMVLKGLLITFMLFLVGVSTTVVRAQTAVMEVTEGDVVLCRSKDACRVLSADQYRTLKDTIRTKVESETPITVEEWKDLVYSLDLEIKRRGGKITLRNVTSKKEMTDKIIQLLK